MADKMVKINIVVSRAGNKPPVVRYYDVRGREVEVHGVPSVQATVRKIIKKIQPA